MIQTTPISSPPPEWKLEYSGIDDPQIADDLAADMSVALAFYEKYHGRVAELTAPELLEALQHREALTGRGRSPLLFAEMHNMKHKDDKAVLAFLKHTHKDIDALDENLLFWDQELQAIPSKKLETMFHECEALERYRPYLEQIRRFAPYQLSEEEEQNLLKPGQPKAEKRDTNLLYEERLNALRCRVPKALVRHDTAASCEARGDYDSATGECLLAPKEIRDAKSDPDSVLRQAAYEASWKTFETFAAQEENSSAALMNRILAARKQENERRGFKRADSATNLGNLMEDETIDTLRSVVKNEGYRLNQRYLALKARAMDKESLVPWDELAPVSSQPERIFTWDEATKIVLDTFMAFSPEMHAIAKQALDEHWIDAAPRAGKHYGAFSADSTDGLRAMGHPYISQQFTGKPRDVLVLAHEIGHTIQDLLTLKNKGDLMGNISPPFAETASIFAETLVFNKLIKEAATDEEKIALLDKKIEETFYSITRQIAYDDFETKIHQEFADHGPLSAERFGELWKQSHRERLGDTVTNDLRDGGHEWAMIPQFFKYGFYVHGYAFGELLADSLYQAYENAAKEDRKTAEADGTQTKSEKTLDFKTRYLQLLSMGSTEHHGEALTQRFGDTFDLGKPEFWEQGLRQCEGMIDQLEELLAKRQALSSPGSHIDDRVLRGNFGHGRQL